MTSEELDKAIAVHDRQIVEVWALFKETRQQMADTDRKIAQTNQRIALVGEQIADTDRKIAQTNQELGKKIDLAVGALANKWGKFVESFLAPGLPQAFEKRGITINQVYQRVKAKRNGIKLEIDLMGISEVYVILVEVKSTLGVDDVKDHLQQLKRFKEFFPIYAEKKVLGAVAGIEIAGEADKFAYRQGLFVLLPQTDTVQIANDEGFKPKIW